MSDKGSDLIRTREGKFDPMATAERLVHIAKDLASSKWAVEWNATFDPYTNKKEDVDLQFISNLRLVGMFDELTADEIKSMKLINGAIKPIALDSDMRCIRGIAVDFHHDPNVNDDLAPFARPITVVGADCKK